jgi:hypothetical protein
VSSSPVVESAESLAKRFAELNATWKEETRHYSKMKTRMEHPAFRDMVAMGDKAVPLILADLEQNGGFGFLALHEITGADPVPEGAAGQIGIIAAAWIEWGRQQGYMNRQRMQ